MNLNWDNLLSGGIGAIIATAISALLSFLLFRKQMKYESNRDFLIDLIKCLQDVHLSVMSNVKISDELINKLSAFQAISFKEIRALHSEIDVIKDAIFKYNSGLSKSLELTAISQEVIQARNAIDAARQKLMVHIDKLT